MALPFVGEIVEGAIGLFDKILNKVAVDKNLKEQLKADYEKQFGEFLKQKENNWTDIVKLQYTTSHNVVVDTARMMVRPLITYGWATFYAWIKWHVVMAHYGLYKETMLTALTQTDKVAAVEQFAKNAFTEWDYYIGLAIITFWFGGRVMEKLTNMTNNGTVASFKKVIWG